MAAVLFRNLCIHLLLVVMAVADGRGHVSGSLKRHGLHSEEMIRQFQGPERSVGNGDFENGDVGGSGNPVVGQHAADQEDSRLQDSAISRNARGFEDLAPHLPLGSLADASEQPVLDREAAAQEQKLEKMAELMGAAQVTAAGSVRSRRGGSGGARQRQAAAAAAAASSGSFVEIQSTVGHRSATETNQSTELTGLQRELANATYQSLMELTGHKHEKATRKKPDIAKPDIAMSLATAEGGDPDGGDPKRDARHQKEMVCYNELTVLGDLNEDGRFSPEEWHQMFKALNSKGKETNWRISPEDFRLGLPNCDFLEFAKGDKKDHKEKGKMWNHIDYYEWQGVMENADKDRDFLLNHAEIVEGGFEPHAGAKSETVEDTKETVADTTS